MQDYYTIPAEDFNQRSNIEFRFVETYQDLCQEIARDLVDLIKAHVSQGKMTKVILPVGPLDYTAFADLCNKERVSCESLVVFAMDEYCTDDNTPIPVDHPLSFRAFFQRNLIDRLDPDKRLPSQQLILPHPANMEAIPRQMDQHGGIDVTYGGFGINGHFAFNSPLKVAVDLESFRNTTVRLVELREGDIIQMAMGGTAGNIEIIPAKACTLGMAELLSAKEIHVTFMRPWHAAVLRRALFGPVTPAFPGSLVQLHPRVKATLTAEAARLPTFSLLQGASK